MTEIETANEKLTDLLTDIGNILEKFIVISPEQRDTLTLWALHTHVFRSYFVTPYIVIVSPTMRSGKTRTLEVLQAITKDAGLIVDISTPALYRTIEEEKGTLLLDELDMRTMSALHKGILNSGYRQGAYVTRSEKGKQRRFYTFGPKAFASIGFGPLNKTLIDRSIVIHVHRKLKSEVRTKLRPADQEEIRHTLQDRLANWAADWQESIEDPTMPDWLNDREEEIWAPLFDIANQAGGDWPERVLRACEVLTAASRLDEPDASVLLLQDLKKAFGNRNRMFSEDLLNAVRNLKDGEYSGPALASKKALSLELKKFEIYSDQIRIGTENKRGYRQAQFDHAWAHYLGDDL